MKLLWIFVLGLPALDNPFHSFMVSGQNVSDGLKYRELHRYRKIHWCITGFDEPYLHQWPASQFVPILQRSTQRFHKSDSRRYNLKILEVKTSQTNVGREGALFKTAHLVFTAEEKRDVKLNLLESWSPMELEGLIIQANYNPETIAMPAGEFIDMEDPIICSDCDHTLWGETMPCRKRSILHMTHPTVLVFHHEMRARKPKRANHVLGRRNEIHANFRCALPVISFTENKWDVVKFGPYEVASRGPAKQSRIHPSPYHPFFVGEDGNVICHGYSMTDLLTEAPEKFIDFEMNSKYDCCTRNEENPKNPIGRVYQDGQTINPTFSCTAAADATVKNPLAIEYGKESWVCGFPGPVRCRHNAPPERPDRPYRRCQTCPDVDPTEIIVTTTEPTGFIKRTPHGMMMIMTNFCLQPIVIYIARFYKETYNAIICKGTKSWYWMHMIGGMISSTMVYFGYFSGGSDNDKGIQAHVILGNIYIMILAFCYMTAWGRNKSYIINIIMEFLHGCLGYTVITMAIVSIVTTPSLGFESKLCIYLMVGFQVIFMIAMTCHICRLDKEFGMRPKRRHFPTIEARFDEVKVPGGKFRKTMLTVFWLTTFILSLTSTFFQ